MHMAGAAKVIVIIEIVLCLQKNLFSRNFLEVV